MSSFESPPVHGEEDLRRAGLSWAHQTNSQSGALNEKAEQNNKSVSKLDQLRFAWREKLSLWLEVTGVTKEIGQKKLGQEEIKLWFFEWGLAKFV